MVVIWLAVKFGVIVLAVKWGFIFNGLFPMDYFQ